VRSAINRLGDRLSDSIRGRARSVADAAVAVRRY
jgi:hypothetical protein